MSIPLQRFDEGRRDYLKLVTVNSDEFPQTDRAVESILVQRGPNLTPVSRGTELEVSGVAPSNSVLERFLAKIAVTDLAHRSLLQALASPKCQVLLEEVFSDKPQLASLQWIEEHHFVPMGSLFSKVSRCLIPPGSSEPFASFFHLGCFRWLKALTPLERVPHLKQLMESVRIKFEGGGSRVIAESWFDGASSSTGA